MGVCTNIKFPEKLLVVSNRMDCAQATGTFRLGRFFLHAHERNHKRITTNKALTGSKQKEFSDSCSRFEFENPVIQNFEKSES